MRTKTLLLSAAVFAAGIGASMAQSVYSINAVGYVNITLQKQFNLICNPLNGTNNNVNTIIPVAPDGAQIFYWRNSSQNFATIDSYIDVGDPLVNAWYLADGQTKSTNTVPPGVGFFLKNPNNSPITLTFVGEVPQGNLTNTIRPNFDFVSSIVPQSVDLDTVGLPQVDGSQFQQWNPLSQRYTNLLTYAFVAPGDPANGWYNASDIKTPPIPGVGEGFVFKNLSGAPLSWGRTFSVNN